MGRFCPIYITATTGGQALGGIFAALAEIASLAIGASSIHSAMLYFIIGIVTILLTIVSYLVLIKSMFFKHHLYDTRINQTEFDNELLRPRISNKIILKKIWPHGLSIFVVFAISMSVCPGVTVLIESEGKGHGRRWNGKKIITLKQFYKCLFIDRCLFCTDHKLSSLQYWRLFRKNLGWKNPKSIYYAHSYHLYLKKLFIAQRRIYFNDFKYS